MRGMIAGFAVAACPVAGLAEGAVSVMDCAFLTHCQNIERCTTKTGDVRFEFAPIGLDDRGRGQLVLTTSEGVFTAYSVAEGGPIVWLDDRETLNSLQLPDDTTVFVWHRFDARASDRRSETFYLDCQVT